MSGSLAATSFAFTVDDTIKANANKVNTVITIPNNPQIGQFGNITVTGCTGTVGAAKVLYFTPVAADSWPADAFEFIDSDIQVDNYAHTPYRDVAVIPTGDVLTTNNCYDEIFTFVIEGVGSATTTPSNYISSGTQIKHTTNTSGSFSVTIPPPECGTITVGSNPSTLPGAVAGQPYSATITASPAPAGTYSFAATGLPSWLTLDASTGALTGTPTAADVGSVSFTVTVTDSGGSPSGCTGQKQFGFDVSCTAITVNSSPASIPNAVEGQPFSVTFSGSPAGTYTFSASSLPSWLNLSSGGALTGTPTSSDLGSVSFTVTATDTTSLCTGKRTVTFNADPANVPVVPILGGPGLALLALGLAGAAFLLIRRG